MLVKYGCAILRPIEDKDFDLLYSMVNDPDIAEGAIGWSYPVSMEQQREFMRTFRNSDRSVKFMVELTNGKTIGMASIDNIDWKNRNATSSYKVSAPLDHRIRGDMRDALIGLLDYAFNELGMHCMYGEFLADNEFSRKLAYKIPCETEGVLRQRVFKRGKYHDVIIVSTLKEEFNKKFHSEWYEDGGKMK